MMRWMRWPAVVALVLLVAACAGTGDTPKDEESGGPSPATASAPVINDKLWAWKNSVVGATIGAMARETPMEKSAPLRAEVVAPPRDDSMLLRGLPALSLERDVVSRRHAEARDGYRLYLYLLALPGIDQAKLMAAIDVYTSGFRERGAEAHEPGQGYGLFLLPVKAGAVRETETAALLRDYDFAFARELAGKVVPADRMHAGALFLTLSAAPLRQAGRPAHAYDITNLSPRELTTWILGIANAIEDGRTLPEIEKLPVSWSTVWTKLGEDWLSLVSIVNPEIAKK